MERKDLGGSSDADSTLDDYATKYQQLRRKRDELAAYLGTFGHQIEDEHGIKIRVNSSGDPIEGEGHDPKNPNHRITRRSLEKRLALLDNQLEVLESTRRPAGPQLTTRPSEELRPPEDRRNRKIP